jgi:hypothetical protein
MNDTLDEKKRRKRERKQQRYAEDPEAHERDKAARRGNWQRTKDVKNAKRWQRYATDPEYREAKLAHTTPETKRKSGLKRNYGLSPEGYGAMLSRQNGVCIICLKEDPNKALSVDHDHKRRLLRDLLCGACNKGLGHFHDDSALMRRGADYLDFWRECHEAALKAGPPSAAGGIAGPHGIPIHHFTGARGEHMSPTGETTDDSNTDRPMRRAILHELLQPFDPDPPPPVDMLQAVSRAIVVKTSQGDITAAKEVFDRIDGKTPTVAPAFAEIPHQMCPYPAGRVNKPENDDLSVVEPIELASEAA